MFAFALKSPVALIFALSKTSTEDFIFALCTKSEIMKLAGVSNHSSHSASILAMSLLKFVAIVLAFKAISLPSTSPPTVTFETATLGCVSLL